MSKDDEKPAKIQNAEITDDGCIIIEFNKKMKANPMTKKAVFDPDILYAMTATADIPNPEDTDFPGLPLIDDEWAAKEEGSND